MSCGIEGWVTFDRKNEMIDERRDTSKSLKSSQSCIECVEGKLNKPKWN